MKKLIIIALVLIYILCMVGCSQQRKQIKGDQLLMEGNVIKVDVSNDIDGEYYSFSGEKAKVIVDYLSNLTLDGTFEENLNELAGTTWVISLEYDNGDILTVYNFGNLLIRSENSSWHKITGKKIGNFGDLLNELNN